MPYPAQCPRSRAIRIMELCEQDDVGTTEVASVLARDPALAAKVLKVANSAICGVRSHVTTLDRAIAIMGINAGLSLSLSFSLVKTLKKSHRNTFDHVTYWRNSIITRNGHQAGDAILVTIARILQSSTRASDLLIRYGGDEFVCILPNTDSDGAKIVADRIRTATRSAQHNIAGNVEVGITLSQGCATAPPGNPWRGPLSLIQQADRCLYAAKRAGRNRIVMSGLIQGETSAEALEPGAGQESVPA